MKIPVTRKHINRAEKLREKGEDNGTFVSAISCPIALAVKEKTHKKVDVGAYDARIGRDGITYHLPSKAQKFIDLFDDRQYVRPFTLILE